MTGNEAAGGDGLPLAGAPHLPGGIAAAQAGRRGAGGETPPRWLRAALAAVILAGLAARVALPGTTVFYSDMVRACEMAEEIASGVWRAGGLTNSGGFPNPPGFVYLLSLVWRVWPSPMGAWAFIAGVNVLAVLLAGLLLRRWFSSTVAWWATAFLAASPWAIQYTQWIWAQDLLFPCSLIVYACLREWLCRGRQWAALGVVLGVALVIQVHLAGVALALAIAALILWWRPRLSLWPVAAGGAIMVAAFLPYLLSGSIAMPDKWTGTSTHRLGYAHFWRAIPAALMSVTGLGWQLEFRDGYGMFVRGLSWRHWIYQGVMLLPVAVFVGGFILAARRLLAEWRRDRKMPRTPLMMVVAMVTLVPLAFMAMGIRTSPTYLPMWYPLPFALMALAACRLCRRPDGRERGWPAMALLLVLAVQLCFFGDQLLYMQRQGGVPGSYLGRNYESARADVAALAKTLSAEEIWMVYRGPSVPQEDTAVYMLTRAQWAGTSPWRAIIYFQWGLRPDQMRIDNLPPGATPPQDAVQVRPAAQRRYR
jgi:hypothetical protein